MKSLADFVKVYDNVFDKQTCETLMQVYNDYENDYDHFRISEHSWHLDYRRFGEVNTGNIAEVRELMGAFYNRIDQVYDSYRRSVKEQFLPSAYIHEVARIKKYEVNGKDQFGWHTDVGDDQSAKRFLVFFTYLNDVDEGGETVFKNADDLDIKIKPKQGRMVVFPPMWMYPHKGEKPISNDKYIVSTYLQY